MAEINIATKELQELIKGKVDSYLDEKISSRAAQSTVNTINSNVGSNNDSANANGSVHAKLKELRTQILNSGGIKSVQRGSTNLSDSNQTVIISPINVNKSFLTMNTSVGQSRVGTGSNSTTNVSCYAYIADSTSVVVGTRNVSATVYWEIIEFK